MQLGRHMNFFAPPVESAAGWPSRQSQAKLLPKERAVSRNSTVSNLSYDICLNGHQKTSKRLNAIGDGPSLQATKVVVEL